MTAASVTSTGFDPKPQNTMRELSDTEIRQTYYNIVKSKQLKGYVNLSTNLGDLNFEIFANYVPQTAENFLELCEQGYYDDTNFHRLIKHFMVNLFPSLPQ